MSSCVMPLIAPPRLDVLICRQQESESEGERERGGETDRRETDRQTERVAHTHTHTQNRRQREPPKASQRSGGPFLCLQRNTHDASRAEKSDVGALHSTQAQQLSNQRARKANWLLGLDVWVDHVDLTSLLKAASTI